MICVMKIIDPQCIWIENQYWSIGPDIIVPDVSDHIACCKLCKEDPECNSFSWGYPSHAYANDCDYACAPPQPHNMHSPDCVIRPSAIVPRLFPT